MALPDSQRFHWNLYLITNVEDIVVFLGLIVLNSFQKYKHWFMIYACESDILGSHEIILTVPLKQRYSIYHFIVLDV